MVIILVGLLFVGGYSGSTGLHQIHKYRVIIESGYFSTVTIGYTTVKKFYLEARAIYGNDYDRAKNNDDLMVLLCM